MLKKDKLDILLFILIFIITTSTFIFLALYYKNVDRFVIPGMFMMGCLSMASFGNLLFMLTLKVKD